MLANYFKLFDSLESKRKGNTLEIGRDWRIVLNTLSFSLCIKEHVVLNPGRLKQEVLNNLGAKRTS